MNKSTTKVTGILIYMVVTNGTVTAYRVHHRLLVEVVLLHLSFSVFCFQILIIPLVSSNSSYSLI